MWRSPPAGAGDVDHGAVYGDGTAVREVPAAVAEETENGGGYEMIGQLQMTTDGKIVDKVEMAIRRLKAFEPPEGYYLAFSGGKDSQCIYHLAKMAGVKFDAHYSLTTVDPPELVQFIKKHYPDAWENRHVEYRPDGKPWTMWNLIATKKIPPTRFARYCCEVLKETGGGGRITVTGVRWAESAKRSANQGAVTIMKTGKKVLKQIDETGAEYRQTAGGGIILNDDNDASRRAVEQCFRTRKTLVNPIIDWDDEDVWTFLNEIARVPHCCLYDQGWSRLGCIGCPMASGRQAAELEKYPKFKVAYMRAFEKMLENRKKAGLPSEDWRNADDVMRWWLMIEGSESP